MNVPESWKNQALYDMETARSMLDAGRYAYVLFCCQQAVEKFLKAIWAHQHQETPPRIHHLVMLAERLPLIITEEQSDFS